MSLVMLKDDERARTCYAAAVAAAQPLEARHVPLLEKLLERQRLANDAAGSARTAELMAAFGTTPGDRATRYVRAARDYLAAGDRDRARGAADRAVESDPYDVDAVDLASGLAIDLGDVDTAAAMLTRLLTAKEDRTSGSVSAQSRRSLLMYRLGAARQQRGDTRQAVPAFERAIQLAPESDGATQARRGLVELIRDDPSAKRDTIHVHLQAITGATGALADLVAWAEELRRTNRNAECRAALDLAIACGHTADLNQTAFLSIHKPSPLRDDEPYKHALDANERRMLTDPDEDELSPVACALAEASALLWPDLEQCFARNDVSGAKRVPATLHAPRCTSPRPRCSRA
jgi:tetratricopeptide (TPR) repeat protein